MATIITVEKKPQKARIIKADESGISLISAHIFHDFPDITDDSTATKDSEVTTVEGNSFHGYTQLEVDAELQKMYDKGFLDGQQITTAVLDTEITALRALVNTVEGEMSSLGSQFKEQLLLLEPTAIDLAIGIAEHILHVEVQHTHIALEQVRTAIASLHGIDEVSVRLHPYTYQALQEAQDEITKDNAHAPRTITLTSDPSVEIGSCILETALGSVDNQIQTQLRRIRQALKTTALLQAQEFQNGQEHILTSSRLEKQTSVEPPNMDVDLGGQFPSTPTGLATKPMSESDEIDYIDDGTANEKPLPEDFSNNQEND